MVLVHDDVAGPQLGEAAEHAATPGLRARRGGTSPAEQPVLGDHRQMELRCDEPGLQARLGERDLAGGRVPALRPVEPRVGPRPLPSWLASQPGYVEAAEVVREPLSFAAPGERHHHPVVRSRELLELGLRLLDPACLDVGSLGAE